MHRYVSLFLRGRSHNGYSRTGRTTIVEEHSWGFVATGKGNRKDPETSSRVNSIFEPDYYVFVRDGYPHSCHNQLGYDGLDWRVG